ncbi:hypothetical protein INT44_008660 [Umbelopsis vinacea]|uniref:glucan endo-1,3-beta-D-glucosidase n=1 Tax=Umbelopsis vinacea TaxID=44442 RepID=A0A8H7PWC8_9FUNG|nr:hypothetical protein INT44_008660 [Umbelopsis vinacea]
MKISLPLTLISCTLSYLASAAPASVSRVTVAPGGSTLYGITYNPKNSDGSCMSQANVNKDIAKFKQNGIINVRTYAQECNQLEQIVNAIATAGGGMTVVAGVWIDGSEAGYQTEVSTLTKSLSSNSKAKGYVSGVIVGNEVLYDNRMSASALASKIDDVKSKVESYGLLVGTAETPSTFDPAIVSSSDFLVANIHPYFGKVSASSAGANLKAQFMSLKSKLNGKDVIIGETGWPTAGSANGQAVPSVQNLQSFVQQLQCENAGLKYYVFDGYDSPWKPSGNLNVEQHWGLWQADGSSKGINIKVSC